MLGTHDLPMFILAGLLLNMTPGVDTLYIAGRTARQGLGAGLVAALSIGAGCIVHILAATVGLSAVLTTSATAFTLVKYLGAAYLLYLGISMLLSKPAPATADGTPSKTDSWSRIFWQGFLTNVLNPKVALFFLAFLPQFINADTEAKWLSMLFLGTIFAVNGTLWCCGIAYWAHAVSRRLRGKNKLGLWLTRASGGLFMYFGVRLLTLTDV